MGMGGGYVPMVCVPEEVEENYATLEVMPQVYENHGIDSRVKGPLNVAPTMSARYGTGGNNIPLVGQPEKVFCIVGNTIDREPENGGNGIGCQEDISYTLTATDRHAVYSRQRVDIFKEMMSFALRAPDSIKMQLIWSCRPIRIRLEPLVTVITRESTISM